MDKSVDARLVELESRLAFQEQALAELSDALAVSRRETAQQADMLRRALDEVKQTRGDFFADPTDEPPPPHY